MRFPFRLQDEIELLTQAKSLFPSQSGWGSSNTHAGFMDPLAQAYFRSGDLERA